MPFLGGLMSKLLGSQQGQGMGDHLRAAAAFGQGAMGGRGLLGALGGGVQGAHQWQQQNPWAPPSAPTMQPFTPGQLPGPVPMPNIAPGNPGVAQMPMPGMQPGGFGTMPPSPNQGLGLGTNGAPNIGPGMMPQYRNLGFGQNRWV